MENSGEIIIYIFLAIFFIVKAIFDSGKKKRQQKQILGPQGRDVEIPEEDEIEDKEDKSFWEILEEMQKPHEEPKPQQVPVTPPVIKQKAPEKRQAVTRKTTASSYTAKTNVASRAKTTSAVKHEDAYTTINEGTFHDMDELKKAIIYSEILNRKY